MLRNSGDTNLQQFLGSITIDSNPKSCSQKLKDKFKKPCGNAQDDLDKLWNMRKQSSCKVNRCLPMKTCKAKIAFHANGEEVVDTQLHGLNLNSNLNVGGNQLGYVYRETQIVDTDRFLDALRNNNPLSQNVVTKIAEQNHNLFNVPYHSIDGTNTGNPITNECPKRSKPCPKPSRCKKPDPMLHNLGIGSDGFESRDSLRDLIEAGRAIKASENAGRALVDLNFSNLETVKPSQPPPVEKAGQEKLPLLPDDRGNLPPEFRRDDDIPEPQGEGVGEATPQQQTQEIMRSIEAMRTDGLGAYLLAQVGSNPQAYREATLTEAGQIRNNLEQLIFGQELTAQLRQRIERSGNSQIAELNQFFRVGGNRKIGRKALKVIKDMRPFGAGGMRGRGRN